MKLFFDWDLGNIKKSELKHGILVAESESIFNDNNKLVFDDIKHSISEKRYICIGKSNENRVLFCYFTIRGIKMRIIGIRIANRKEKALYEKGLEK